MRAHRTRLAAAAVAAAVLALPGTAAPAASAAAGAAHYVDNRPGSHCSDTGPGTSPDAPWCGFAPANSLTLGPGSRLLLARGAVFAQALSPTAAGSADAPAAIAAYGHGPRPRITGNSTGAGLSLTDPDQLAVRDLDIGSTSGGHGDLRYGIRTVYTTPGHHGLAFTDLSLHDSRTAALDVDNTGTYTTTRPVLDGLAFRSVETTHNAHGIVVTSDAAPSDLPPDRPPGKVGENAFTDVVADRLNLHGDDNNNGDPARVPSQIDIGCPDGLALSRVEHARVTNSVLNGEAGCRTTYGTAALYLGSARDVLIANNIITGTPDTRNPDMVAIDHESRTSRVTIRGNYLAHNFGGGVEYLAIHGAQDFHSEDALADNTFDSNGVRADIPYPPDGAVGQLGSAIKVAARISGNLYHEPFAFLTAKQGGDVSAFAEDNNIPVGSSGDLSQSAHDFAAPGGHGPWSYRAHTAAGWTPLTWNPADSAYRGHGTLTRFTAAPDGAALARVWTAPRSGTVSIRGFALPADGAGTGHLSLTRNGHPLDAPRTAGPSGTATDLDDLTVHRGDVLRFTTEAASAPLSWAPTVAYTAAAHPHDPAGTWTFSADGDTQGWTGTPAPTARRGRLDIPAAGPDTTLRSAPRLGLSTRTRSALRLRLDNRTTATGGTVSFTTRSGRTGTVPFHLNPRAVHGIATADHDYLVPLAGDPAWDGTLDRLTVTFHHATGRISADSIALTRPPAKSWDFDTGGDGWTLNPDTSRPSAGRPASRTVPDLDNTSGAFTPHADLAFAFTRMQTFRAARGSLARIDLWAAKQGDPKGSLFLRVVKLRHGDPAAATTLFQGSVAPSQVPAGGGPVSIHPGLTHLDPKATYGLVAFAPYQAPGAAYGIRYNDGGRYPDGHEYYSADENGTWHGPEAGGRRSLEFRTYAFAGGTAPAPPGSGFTPVATAGGKITGSGGYEPTLRSPADLGITAADHRYVRIRMNNPDNRPTGHLLFTTAADPDYDRPGGGTPPQNETARSGVKGIAFALDPGPDYVEYTLDMSTVPGWKGTVEQLQLQPLNRWNYHLTGLDTAWHGGIDTVRVD